MRRDCHPAHAILVSPHVLVLDTGVDTSSGTLQICRRVSVVGRWLGSSVGYSSGRAVPVPCRANEIRAPVTSSLRTAGQARGKGRRRGCAIEFDGWAVVR
jgi:hypothetical protein